MASLRLPAAVFGFALLVSLLGSLHGIQPNDEGLMLQAAARIGDGELPYRDFWWYYPPGQPYLLAGLSELTGPSLVTWRVLRALSDATVALLAFWLARRYASTPLALAAGAAVSLAMATPSGPHPFPIALALALGALLAFSRRPALAGVLVGVCAVWRIEFAGYLGLAIVLALVLLPEAGRDRLRPAARFAATAVVCALLLLAPVVIAAGPGTSLDLLVRYPIQDFGDYQTLPFPLGYDGPLNLSSVGGFLSDSAENLLEHYVPLVLCVGLLASLVVLAVNRRSVLAPQLATSVFAVGMLHYLLVRPDAFHTAPLAVVVSVLAAWSVALPVSRRALRVPAVLAAVAVAYLIVHGIDRRVLVLGDRGVPLELEAADGVRVPPREAQALRRTVTHLRRAQPGGGPIYVTTRRADLVTAGNPLLYVLAGRPNATRYDIAAPGVVTSAPVQREIVRSLERSGLPPVVRDTDPITAAPEPNRAGRPTGVKVLERFLARRYEVVARYGPYVVLERLGR